MISRRGVRALLLTITGFNAISAVGGGIGLLTPGSIGMPLSFLEGSSFTSYLWPAIILVTVIGGTQAGALVLVARRGRNGLLVSAIAGFALVIWIFVELAIMGEFFAIHAIFMTTALVQLASVIALLGAAPQIVERDPSLG